MKKICPLLLVLLLISCTTNKNPTTPFNHTNINQTEIIKTNNGFVRGIVSEDDFAELFAGIPFAQPPINELRWKETQPVKNWDGILEANNFAPIAMQKRFPKIFTILYNAYIHTEDRTDYAPMSEDCLYLNIWRPRNFDYNSEQKLPVLVYIHGGSLMTGSSWFKSYDGENLSKKGIIVITIAYRTGVFGFFAHPQLIEESPNGTTGNYGLLDQIMALKWINKNIEFFGGDSKNITIAGESAGSSSVSALCVTPLAKGLFKNAIGESSSLILPYPPHTFRSMSAATKMGNDIMEEYKCTNIAQLRNIKAEKLIQTKFSNNSMTIDNYSIVEFPYQTYLKKQNNEQALLNGFNSNEANVFTFFRKITTKNLNSLLQESLGENTDKIIQSYKPKNNKDARLLYNDIFAAICFSYPHYSWTKINVQNQIPVYEYYFSKENKSIGANHSGELVYAYNNIPNNKYFSEDDKTLSDLMSEYWVNFVKTGNPNGQNLPEWQESSACNGKLLEFGDTIQMIEDPYKKFYDYLIWKEY